MLFLSLQVISQISSGLLCCFAPLRYEPDWSVMAYCVVLFPSGNKLDQSVLAYCVVLFPSGNKPDQSVMAYCVV